MLPLSLKLSCETQDILSKKPDRFNEPLKEPLGLCFLPEGGAIFFAERILPFAEPIASLAELNILPELMRSLPTLLDETGAGLGPGESLSSTFSIAVATASARGRELSSAPSANT